MRLNAPAVGNKLDFFFPLVFFFADTLNWLRRKISWPHLCCTEISHLQCTPVSVSSGCLFACVKKHTTSWKNNTILSACFISPHFFAQEGRREFFIWPAIKHFFPTFNWVIKRLGWVGMCSYVRGSGTVTARSKLHLWASLHIELAAAAFLSLHCLLLATKGNYSCLVSTWTVDTQWINGKQNEGRKSACRKTYVRLWRQHTSCETQRCSDAFLLVSHPAHSSKDSDWLTMTTIDWLVGWSRSSSSSFI